MKNLEIIEEIKGILPDNVLMHHFVHADKKGIGGAVYVFQDLGFIKTTIPSSNSREAVEWAYQHTRKSCELDKKYLKNVELVKNGVAKVCTNLEQLSRIISPFLNKWKKNRRVIGVDSLYQGGFSIDIPTWRRVAIVGQRKSYYNFNLPDNLKSELDKDVDIKGRFELAPTFFVPRKKTTELFIPSYGNRYSYYFTSIGNSWKFFADLGK
jgi:hypothetical protein